MGMILGFYLPLMSRARNDDCFAAFWTLGLNLYRWHTFFDFKSGNGIDDIFDWVEFLTIPGMTGYQIFLTNRSCFRQRRFNEKTHWMHKFHTKGTYGIPGFLKPEKKPEIKNIGDRTHKVEWKDILKYDWDD
jgi:hypothetical protein